MYLRKNHNLLLITIKKILDIQLKFINQLMQKNSLINKIIKQIFFLKLMIK